MTTIAAFAEGFTLQSSDMQGQMSIKQEFNGFGCSGQNISPQLHWSDAPKASKSFAITIYDADAPTGSGWWHWLVVNIPKESHSIVSNASANKQLPKGAIESMNDYLVTHFGGACPPKGDLAHQYVTTIHALDVESLPIKAESNPALVGYMINAHTIAKSSIITYYGRP